MSHGQKHKSAAVALAADLEAQLNERGSESPSPQEPPPAKPEAHAPPPSAPAPEQRWWTTGRKLTAAVTIAMVITAVVTYPLGVFTSRLWTGNATTKRAQPTAKQKQPPGKNQAQELKTIREEMMQELTEKEEKP